MKQQKDIRVKVAYSDGYNARFNKAICKLYLKKRGKKKGGEP